MIAVAGYGTDPSKVYASLCDVNPEALVCKGFEQAYIGFTVAAKPSAVYDYDVCIDIVVGEGDITEEEAVAYFYFNTLSKCDQPFAPVFVRGQQP
jgi:hypothetical protein